MTNFVSVTNSAHEGSEASPTEARISLLLPDLRFGGAERVNIHLANEFVARGHAVDMVLMDADGELFPLLDPRVHVVDLGVRRMRSLLPPLVRYLRERRPSALLANMWPLTVTALAAVRLAGMRRRTRTVVVEHNNWTIQARADRRLLRLARKLSMRVLFPWASARVGVSNGVAADLERHAWLREGSVQCVYNPVTGIERSHAPMAASPEIDRWARGDHARILAVGVLQAQKRFDWLLAAFARLRTQRETRLLILGDGPERGALEAIVAAHGLQDRVCMPGFVDNPAAYYAHADLFVLSSEYEGLSLVLVEALEQGTPVVSMDCPSGPREVLEDGKYGDLVPVGDVDAMAEAIAGALGRPHDREALRRRARDFSVHKSADAYLDLLLPGQAGRVDATGIFQARDGSAA